MVNNLHEDDVYLQTKNINIVCTPPPSPFFAGGGLNLLLNFQKGEAWQGVNFAREVAGKEGVTILRGGLQILQKS